MAGRAGGGRKLPRPLSGMPQKCARRVFHVDHVRPNGNLDASSGGVQRTNEI